MRSTRANYVFIYNGKGAYPESCQDLKELFSSHNILDNPIVLECDFNINFDGINGRPTFVVPGGSAGIIAGTLIGAKPERKIMQKIKASFGENFNYAGICAGGFIATPAADIYDLSEVETTSPSTASTPKFNSASRSEMQISLGLMPDFKAIGPFYPHGKRSNEDNRYFVPHRVSLTFQTAKDITLSQLYVAGPGFVPLTADAKNRAEVVAVYSDRNRYVFFDKDKNKTEVENLPAMIRRLPTEKEGARILSGTHIETCVPGSKVLKDFQSATQFNAALSVTDQTALAADKNKSREMVETLLKETFTPARNQR